MRLTDFKALTFDCYGTLIDWESGMIEALKPLTDRRTPLTRDAILEAHARHESVQQLRTPGKRYSDLLAVVYKRLAEEWKSRRAGTSACLWPVREGLAGLSRFSGRAGLSQAALQAGHPLECRQREFQLQQQELGVDFDAIYTAEDIGSYKPSRAISTTCWRSSRARHREGIILHTAESMFHDHKPANEVGLKSCWIYRRHADEGFGATMHPGDIPAYDFRFTSMAELAKAHQAEVKA